MTAPLCFFSGECVFLKLALLYITDALLFLQDGAASV